jgi:hypothetical protein
LQFVGYSSDLQICAYVHTYLKRQIVRLGNEHMKSKRFRKRSRLEAYKQDYLTGLAYGVTAKAYNFYQDIIPSEHGTMLM